MVTFLTLFIEIVAGIQSVQVAVAGPVARVVLYLDARPVATMTAPPWKANISLGGGLAPQALTAVAYDQSGHELSRDRQLINLPQRQVDARIVPLTDGSMKVTGARLVWWAPGLGPPRRIECSVGRRSVATTKSGVVDLSGFADGGTHLLEARLEFRGRVSCSRTLMFGGGQLADTSAHLTSVPIAFEGRKPPHPDSWDGWFQAGDKQLVVDAIDDDLPLTIVVRDLGVWGVLSPWLEKEQRLASVRAPAPSVYMSRRQRSRVAVQVGEPVPSGRDDSSFRSVNLFRFSSPDMNLWRWFPWLLMGGTHHRAGTAERMVSAAVAVAGNLAARDNRRRAVVLCLGEGGADTSRYAVGTVRSYLQDLRVPLLVWKIHREADERNAEQMAPSEYDQKWGDVRDIRNLMALRKQVTSLKKLLDHQRIVWVRGEYLPQEISLGPSAHDIRIAGSPELAAARH